VRLDEISQKPAELRDREGGFHAAPASVPGLPHRSAALRVSTL
jgi:hypothetical protein